MEHKWFVGTSPRYSDTVKDRARELREKEKLDYDAIAIRLTKEFGFDKDVTKSSIGDWINRGYTVKDNVGVCTDFRVRLKDFKGKKGTSNYTDFTPGIKYTIYLEYGVKNYGWEWDSVEDYLKFECEYCGKIHEYFGDDYHETDRKQWQIDHRIPKHLKTPNNGMPENMALCCTSCNQIKGEYELDELLPVLKRIVKHQENNNG